MSIIDSKADFGYASLFNPNYFQRQDDVLNVFKGVDCYSHADPKMLFTEQAYEQNDLTSSSPAGNGKSWNLEAFSSSLDFKSLDKEIESLDATIDNFECSELSENNFDAEEEGSVSPRFGTQADTSKEGSVSIVDDSFTSLRFKIHDGSKYQATSAFDNKSSVSNEKTDHSSKPSKAKKNKKLFSRRKDVIIKTLLRKCRKFYIKDFNSKMNYMKQKRKQTNKIYVTLLRNYLNSVLNVNNDDKVAVFLGAYLYQQDLEENMDLICSPNLLSAEVKDTSDKIYEILYKYSHHKFRVFAKNSEFLPIFMHFYNHGSDALRNDPEYQAGLEIIKDQIQSSLQDC